MNRNERLKTFSERLAIAMNIAGIARGELYHLLAAQGEEVSRSAVYKWRNGRAVPIMRRVRVIARVLNTTPAFLLGEEAHIELCRAGSHETSEESPC